MKKAIGVGLGILLLAGSSLAQETPRTELSASYSYLRLGFSDGVNQHGGSGSVAINLNRWFGIAGDVGAYHSSPQGVSLTTYTFMVGPRFSARREGSVTPFAQVLFGGAHMTANWGGVSGATTPFAMTVGGGLDMRLSRRLALRPQMDYVALRSNGSALNSMRASLGLVFRFGGLK